ncbi:MAG: hypothetical protein WCV59_02665 [Parcubacteria group bacterium]|jgi:hypothetical protein
MENVLELFSKGKDLSADLAEKVEKVCLIVERLDKFKSGEERRILWEEFEDMLGIEVEICHQVIKDDETGEVIDEYVECSVNQRPDNLFWHLCQNLPSLYTVDWTEGRDYVILPNGFVIELCSTGLYYSKNINSLTNRILDEIKSQEEYRKECEESEREYYSSEECREWYKK